MQARYYDPIIGRFYSNDPVDALSHLSTPNGIHGFNRYAYANNNPFRYTDPSGKSSVDANFNVQLRQLKSGQLSVQDIQSDLQEATSHESLTQLADLTGTGAAAMVTKNPLAAGVLQLVSTSITVLDATVHSNKTGTTLAKEVVSETGSKFAEKKVKALSFLSGDKVDAATTAGAIAGDQSSQAIGDLIKVEEEFKE